MTYAHIARQRLYNQHITGTPFEKPDEVVRWHGAVQSQEYAHAKWALGLRMRTASDDQIERAFNEGGILRTHILRPTWHFVTPEDIRWLLALTAPRVHALNAYMYRQLNIGGDVLVKSLDAITKALEGGNYLTRAEIGDVLAQAGITAEGLRLGYFVHHAELDALICSGPRRGKQFTYALLDERAPQAKTLARDEALAELTRRYFTSHGPATMKDFAAWASLTVADIKAGLEMVGSDLAHEEFDGRTYWFAPSAAAAQSPIPHVLLLPPYDEYVNYRDHSIELEPAFSQIAAEMIYGGVIVIDGRVVGYWRRTLKKHTVIVSLEPFRPLTSAEKDAAAEVTHQYREFLGLAVELV